MAAKDKFRVEIAFEGSFSIELDAEDIGDAYKCFHDQDLREQVFNDIDNPEIVKKLEILAPWIRSIEFA